MHHYRTSHVSNGTASVETHAQSVNVDHARREGLPPEGGQQQP
jgi:hypothetical protein